MDDIQLNFIPLEEQNKKFIIYRKPVESSSSKDIKDYRVNLPSTIGDEDWAPYDVSLEGKDGYQSFEADYSLNSVLTLHVIYHQLVNLLNSQDEVYFELPQQKTIARKEIYFTHKSYSEGNSVIVVSPYFLKKKFLFGFLFEHVYSANCKFIVIPVRVIRSNTSEF